MGVLAVDCGAARVHTVVPGLSLTVDVAERLHLSARS